MANWFFNGNRENETDDIFKGHEDLFEAKHYFDTERDAHVFDLNYRESVDQLMRSAREWTKKWCEREGRTFEGVEESTRLGDDYYRYYRFKFSPGFESDEKKRKTMNRWLEGVYG